MFSHILGQFYDHIHEICICFSVYTKSKKKQQKVVWGDKSSVLVFHKNKLRVFDQQRFLAPKIETDNARDKINVIIIYKKFEKNNFTM
jgi:hypothetical protein